MARQKRYRHRLRCSNGMPSGIPINKAVIPPKRHWRSSYQRCRHSVAQAISAAGSCHLSPESSPAPCLRLIWRCPRCGVARNRMVDFAFSSRMALRMRLASAGMKHPGRLATTRGCYCATRGLPGMCVAGMPALRHSTVLGTIRCHVERASGRYRFTSQICWPLLGMLQPVSKHSAQQTMFSGWSSDNTGRPQRSRSSTAHQTAIVPRALGAVFQPLERRSFSIRGLAARFRGKGLCSPGISRIWPSSCAPRNG